MFGLGFGSLLLFLSLWDSTSESLEEPCLQRHAFQGKIMAADVVNIFVIMVIGVIIADMLMPGHAAGTKALFNGISSIWQTSVNAMLGQPTKPPVQVV